jgi:hypothetical protein
VIARLANFLLFQAGWVATVASAGAGHPWAGPLVALALVGAQLAAGPDRAARLRTVTTVAWVAVLGTALDTALRWAGVTAFPDWPATPWPCPPWITALWALYASTLGSSMAWLQGRPAVAALLGAVSGPLSYLAAERLGAVVLAPDPLRRWAVLALAWAVAVPVTLAVARRVSGRPDRTAPAAP